MVYQASKIRGRWVVVDTKTNVKYYPPKGVRGQPWAILQARELNQLGKGNVK